MPPNKNIAPHTVTSEGEKARLDQFKYRSEVAMRRVLPKSVPEAELRSYLGSQRDYQTTRDIRWTRIVERRLERGESWEEIKKDSPVEAETQWLDSHPREAPFHDILVVRRTLDEDDDTDTPDPKRYRYHRFLAIKEGLGRGGYQGPGGEILAEQGLADDGYRAVLNLATTARGSADERGPIFSALPLNPDPAASSSCTCYLINPSNLNYATAWTAEEWSDQPGDEGAPLEPGKDTFALLIASPGGKVYYLEKTNEGDLKAPVEGEIKFHEVSLAGQPEIWSQLRNGCVIGRVLYTQSDNGETAGKVTPLVNIHSLEPTADHRK